MERLAKNQAVVLMFLLMVSAVIMDTLLESHINGPLRTSGIAFSLVMGMLWILEQSGAEKWPKTTLAHKLTKAAVVAAVPPLALNLVGLFR